MFEKKKKREIKFQNYIAENSSLTPRTKEDDERFGLKRKGRLKNEK
ncbi:MAG: hypothetical protein KDD40_06465 [Bdellovibrionales bacterium]|nr:hypothetical protein [Bdellovibrionales bacterium]